MPQPPTQPSHLSKRHFLDHLQCPRRLHLAVHHPDLATPRGAGQQALLDQGLAVGRGAHALFPEGVLVDELEHAAAAAKTQTLLTDPDVPALFEAAFEHQGVRIRVDVLVRLPLERFALCEVKSAKKWKDNYGPDLAVQLWVLRGCGVDVASCELIHVDDGYVRGDGAVRWERFFRREDRTGHVESISSQVDAWLAEMKSVLERSEPPEIEPGKHCRSPHPCPFWQHCTAGRSDEWFLQQKRVRYEVRRRWIDAVSRGERWVSAGLAEALGCAEPPTWYLDFEALGPAIPIHEGVRPYEAIAFQYSLHRLEADGATRHQEFLADGGSDPREAVAESLLEALGQDGDPIVVYGDYESRMLRDMADHSPELAAGLRSLDARLVDLLPIVRSGVYDGAFHGSFSLKAVAPALAPHVRYDDLEGIADGTAAAGAYARLAAGELDDEVGERTRSQLLSYCERDTLALMETHRALRAAAGIPAEGVAPSRNTSVSPPTSDEAAHTDDSGPGDRSDEAPAASAPAIMVATPAPVPARARDQAAPTAPRPPARRVPTARRSSGVTPEERARLLEATALAYEWHDGQTRKHSSVPYVSHLLQVKGLVLEHHGDADQAIAALLHDALEDAPNPAERKRRESHIEARFGREVLDIVLHCTDTLHHEAGDEKGPWRERKERYLGQLQRESDRSLLVAACDKRHNLYALVWDVETQGIEYLSRFNADATEQIWYFEQIVETVQGRIPERLQRELEALLARLRELSR